MSHRICTLKFTVMHCKQNKVGHSSKSKGLKVALDDVTTLQQWQARHWT